MRRPSSFFLVFLVAAAFFAACGEEPIVVAPEAADESPAAAIDEPMERVGELLDGLELPAGEASLKRNFYFIFDGSGSMNERPEGSCSPDRFETKVAGARWAVNTFLEKVPEDVHLGLYLFDTHGQREVVPLGGGRDAFLREIDHLMAGRGTPLAAAIRFGVDRLVEQYQKQLGYGEYRLVVVTDGLAKDIPEAAGYARQWGMPIYAIGLCIGEDHPLRRWAVSYRAADDFDDLARGLEETLAELPSYDATEFTEPR